MQGQQFLQKKIHAEKNLRSSELYKFTQARICIYRRFITKRSEKDTHHVCIRLDYRETKIQEYLEDMCVGGVGTIESRKAAYFSHVSPLDPCPDPKYEPCIHMKNHHDRLFVIDLDAAQNSLEFRQTANGSVSCNNTVPAEFLTKIINIKNGQKVS